MTNVNFKFDGIKYIKLSAICTCTTDIHESMTAFEVKNFIRTLRQK